MKTIALFLLGLYAITVVLAEEELEEEVRSSGAESTTNAGAVSLGSSGISVGNEKSGNGLNIEQSNGHRRGNGTRRQRVRNHVKHESRGRQNGVTNSSMAELLSDENSN